jgi:hypothetical protein
MNRDTHTHVKTQASDTHRATEKFVEGTSETGKSSIVHRPETGTEKQKIRSRKKNSIPFSLSIPVPNLRNT